MGDMSGEGAGQGSSDTRRLWKKDCTILAREAGHCPAEGGEVPRAVKLPNVAVAVQIALNT